MFWLKCTSFLPSPDLDVRYFWKWSAFEDYLLFCFGLAALGAVVTLLLLDSVVFVEALGSLAVTFEAMLALPQLLQNLQNRSTRGMRYGLRFYHQAQNNSCLFTDSQWTKKLKCVSQKSWKLQNKPTKKVFYPRNLGSCSLHHCSLRFSR